MGCLRLPIRSLETVEKGLGRASPPHFGCGRILLAWWKAVRLSKIRPKSLKNVRGTLLYHVALYCRSVEL